jgi:ribonuclease HI
MITLFTDGSALGNPGPGGWAVLLRTDGGDQLLSGGHSEPTTNNRMELTAVLQGLRLLDRPNAVTIVTDSEYVRGVLSLGWKRKANLDLLAALDRMLAVHQVTFQVVRGHSEHPENDRVDQAAQAAARMARSVFCPPSGLQPSTVLL